MADSQEPLGADSEQLLPDDSVTPTSPSEPSDGELADIIRQALSLEEKDGLRREYTSPPIIIHQTTVNRVENSGTIYGNISQHQQKDNSSPSPQAISSSEGLKRFFQNPIDLEALTALIALATLEPLSEPLFYKAAQILSPLISHFREGQDERAIVSSLRTVDELLTPFTISRKNISAIYGAAELQLPCLSFQDETLASQIRKFIWEKYPQLRNLLIEWLFLLKEHVVGTSEAAFAFSIMRGLASFASLDAAYTCRYILPLWEDQNLKTSDLRFLTAFLRPLMEVVSLQPVMDEILCRWCTRSKSFLWQAAYRLYGADGQWAFSEKLSLILRDHLQRDITGTGLSYSAWYHKSRGYLLYPAHTNAFAADLLFHTLADLFDDCSQFKERYHLAVYFLSLFRWDYLTDFGSTPQLVFFRSLRENKRLLPLIQFVWQRRELRSVMSLILQRHFSELAPCGASCDYLKRPFLLLAFTNNHFDYDITQEFLTQCASDPSSKAVAEYLKCYLIDFYNKRKAGLQKKGQLHA